MAAILFADLVANNTTDRRAADRADSAAAGQDGATHSTDTGTDRGVLILLRHAGTTRQADQHGYCCRLHC